MVFGWQKKKKAKLAEHLHILLKSKTKVSAGVNGQLRWVVWSYGWIVYYNSPGWESSGRARRTLELASGPQGHQFWGSAEHISACGSCAKVGSWRTTEVVLDPPDHLHGKKQTTEVKVITSSRRYEVFIYILQHYIKCSYNATRRCLNRDFNSITGFQT